MAIQAQIPPAADSGLPYTKAEILSLVQGAINTAISLIAPVGAVSIFKYAGDPNGALNPNGIPSICIDTTNLGRIWTNIGTSANTWNY